MTNTRTFTSLDDFKRELSAALHSVATTGTFPSARATCVTERHTTTEMFLMCGGHVVFDGFHFALTAYGNRRAAELLSEVES